MGVAKPHRLLVKMRASPGGWRIEQLKTIADSLRVQYRQQGTSHVVFYWRGIGLVTIPAARPIKPVYIRQFLAFVDRVEGLP